MKTEDILGLLIPVTFILFLVTERLFPRRSYPPIRFWNVIGFIGLAGPYDFLPFTSVTLENVFGAAPDLPATQPATFVQADSPRALVLYGEQDTTVLPEHSKRLAKRIRAVGGRVAEVGYPDLGHASIVGVLAKPYQGRAPVLEEVTRFISAGETRFASAPEPASR